MTLENDQGSAPGPSSASNNNSLCLLGVDTGGTFTDFVFYDGSRLQVLKLSSTPAAPEQAVLQGKQTFAERQSAPLSLNMVHGSTVATNALLEGKLARSAYVTNKGLADVLTIGRQARAQLYNLQPTPELPPVPRALCLEVDQRTEADGSEITSLSDAALAALVEQISDLQPEAVAINLLFSFKNSEAEQRIEQALISQFGSQMQVSRSSTVLPEYREYERGIATWLNAALAPRISRYLQPLKNSVAQLAIMHGAAGTVDADQASNHAVNLLLSGPAAGLLGARYMGRLSGCERLLSFDMGGTSTDVALLDANDTGQLKLTSEAKIGGYPVAVPMVDMHTIGAGGGSIAYVDAGGMLRVGPASAGADPGPACYGKGGTEPTVTDANVVLGYLPATSQLGGDLPLDVSAAHTAMMNLAEQMKMPPEQAAEGVLAVANETMAKALRVISVQRGEDPGEFTLLCFGGAGGLHVCALAQALGMTRALVPVYAGVLSALGMLVARRSRQLSQSLLQRLDQTDHVYIQDHFQALFSQGATELQAQGFAERDLSTEYSLDLRYEGQSFSLNVPWHSARNSLSRAQSDFHAAHKARYGHALDLPIEVANLRLTLSAPAPNITLPELPLAQRAPEPIERAQVHGVASDVPVFDRDSLHAEQVITGPAIVRERVSTAWLAPGWRCEVDRFGNLMLAQLPEKPGD